MDELLPKALPVESEITDEAADPKWDIAAQSAASYLKMVSFELSGVRLTRDSVSSGCS